jgi:DNA/RNA endonuclease YhcR with UshA esterase domain
MMKFAASLLFALMTSALFAADAIPSAQAKDHVGETATVCGKVASTRYLDKSEKRPTFLNFDKPSPNQTFTAVIFGQNRAKFGTPEQTFRDKNVCVTGAIATFGGKPEIELTNPQQIRLDSK